ncbi:MAG: diguanylate cyclase domain-containing protein [Kineosporiaceae bacterium]
MEAATETPVDEAILVHADTVAVARRALRSAIPALAAALVLFLVIVGDPAEPGRAAAFCGVVLGADVGVAVACSVLARRVTRARLRLQHGLIIGLGVVYSTAWGASPLVFDLGDDVTTWLSVTVFLVAMTGLNAVGYSTLTGAVEVSAGAMWLLFPPQLVMSGIPVGWPIALACLVFAMMCIVYGAINGRQTRDSFRLRHRNEALARRLAASEERARAVVETAAEAIWTTDATGTVTSANAAAAELCRTRVEDLVGTPLTGWLDGLTSQDLGDLRDVETLAHRTDGSRTPVLVSSSRTGGDGGLTLIARDISERKRLELELAHQATHDSLTGLLNRAGLLARLDQLPDHPASALLLVDLDGFKAVNDAHGHAAGDAVLVAVADRLRRLVRDGDDVGRLGGDEFVAVLRGIGSPETAADSVAAVVDRIGAELSAPVVVDGHRLSVGASVGVAWTSQAPGSPRLLAAADQAMYEAKTARRARGRESVR